MTYVRVGESDLACVSVPDHARNAHLGATEPLLGGLISRGLGSCKTPRVSQRESELECSLDTEYQPYPGLS